MKGIISRYNRNYIFHFLFICLLYGIKHKYIKFYSEKLSLSPDYTFTYV